MAIVTCANCGAKNRVKDDALPNQQPKCGKCGSPLAANRATDTGHPIYITDANFDQVVSAAGGKPLLIDCWAPWCGPCRIVGPIMDELASEARGRYQIGKLNVDENPRTAARFRIASIPTMLLFKNGELLDRLVGAQPKNAIAARLASA